MLGQLGLDYAVVAVAAAIDHVVFVGIYVVEEEETVAQKLHLWSAVEPILKPSVAGVVRIRMPPGKAEWERVPWGEQYSRNSWLLSDQLHCRGWLSHLSRRADYYIRSLGRKYFQRGQFWRGPMHSRPVGGICLPREPRRSPSATSLRMDGDRLIRYPMTRWSRSCSEGGVVTLAHQVARLAPSTDRTCFYGQRPGVEGPSQDPTARPACVDGLDGAQ